MKHLSLNELSIPEWSDRVESETELKNGHSHKLENDKLPFPMCDWAMWTGKQAEQNMRERAD